MGFKLTLKVFTLLTAAVSSFGVSPSVCAQDVFGAAKALPAKPAAPAKSAGGTAVRSAPTARPAVRRASTGSIAAPRTGARNYRATEQGGAVPSTPPALVKGYCNKLWMKIQTTWDLPNGKNHVILGVDVDPSGNVVSTKATSQPHSAEAEEKAQAALTKSQPLDALPTGLPSAHLTITFDSTADPHGDSSSGGSVRLDYNPNSPPNSATAAAPAAPSSAPISAPSSAAPVEQAPVQSVPVQATPVQSTPVQSTPVQTIPVQSAPVQSVPVQQPVQSQPAAAKPDVDPFK